MEYVGNKTCFLFICQICIVMVPFRFKFIFSPRSLAPPGDSTVSVGEGVPGACLLPPPHGPGGALPVAGPDDALSVGQHDRPGEADPVSPGVCHRPQVRTGSRPSVGALSLTLYDNISQRVNSYFDNCLCLSCNLFYSHIINASLLLLHGSTNAPKFERDGTLLCDSGSLLRVQNAGKTTLMAKYYSKSLSLKQNS